jgi:hypothetical protein
MKEVQATYNLLASKLGDGTKITRSLVASFSLAAVKRHTIYRKFEAEPDNPFAFLLNHPNDITFSDFLSAAPRAVLVDNGRTIPRRRLLKTYKYFCNVLGNGAVIYRHAVVAFSLSKMINVGRIHLNRPRSTAPDGASCVNGKTCPSQNAMCKCQKIPGMGKWCDSECKADGCRDMGATLPCF